MPDRWVLALASSLRAHDGLPTYGDVFNLMELSLEQMIGLAESAGGVADRRLFAGLRELLASAASTSVNRAALVEHGVLGRDVSFLEAAVKPNLANAQQRRLAEEFLAVFHRKILDPGQDWNGRFGFVFHSFKDRNRPPDTTKLSLGVSIVTGDTMNAGYLLSLPLVLPDDRRDRTTVDVLQ